MRFVLSTLLCATALGLGLWTAHLAARNRARGGELDALHHRCGTLRRQNELLRVQNRLEEWRLLNRQEDASIGSLGTMRSVPAGQGARI